MDRLTALAARHAVTDRVTELFVATDEGAWDRVGACFTDMVHFDMSSAGGGPAQEVESGAIVTGWRSGLAPVEAVHHQVGNLRIELRAADASEEPSTATVRCHGVAWHWLPNPTGRNSRTFVGMYELGLRGEGDVTDPAAWRIHRFGFDLRFIDGNPDLEAHVQGETPREV